MIHIRARLDLTSKIARLSFSNLALSVNFTLLSCCAGLNTGTLLLRNDKDFSARFWRDTAHVSRINQQLPQGTPDTPEGRIKVRVFPSCFTALVVSTLNRLAQYVPAVYHMAPSPGLDCLSASEDPHRVGL